MKSSELSEKQKENLIVHCSSFRGCSECSYDDQCVEHDEFLSDMIKYNIPFEIKLLPEHEEKKMDTYAKCKNCGQVWGKHSSGGNRCPLIDFEDIIVNCHYGKTFFEAEESELDRLIESLEFLRQNTNIRYYFFEKKNINIEKLLKELKELKK